MARWYLVPFFASAALALSVSAPRADQYPNLNVAPLCHGITEQSDLQEGFRNVTFEECIKAEQEDRATVIKEWSNFTAAERSHCTAEVTMGGESSYTELLTCLEMARDVRLLKQTKRSDQSTEGSQPQSSSNGQHRRGGGS